MARKFLYLIAFVIVLIFAALIVLAIMAVLLHTIIDRLATKMAPEA